MAEAYPFLRSICQLFGYGYEIVDMRYCAHLLYNCFTNLIFIRWGVREFAGATHATGELCISELHKCLQVSLLFYVHLCL